MCRLRGKRLTL